MFIMKRLAVVDVVVLCIVVVLSLHNYNSFQINRYSTLSSSLSSNYLNFNTILTDNNNNNINGIDDSIDVADDKDIDDDKDISSVSEIIINYFLKHPLFTAQSDGRQKQSQQGKS